MKVHFGSRWPIDDVKRAIIILVPGGAPVQAPVTLVNTQHAAKRSGHEPV